MQANVKNVMTTHARVKEILGPCVLFFIERSTDDAIVVFSAERKANNVNGIDSFATKLKSLSQRAEISSAAKKALFGCELKAPAAGKTRYQMKVDVMPKRLVELVLKKPKNGEKCGEVVARTVIDGKECDILKLTVKVGAGTLGIPSVDAVILTGTHNGNVCTQNVTDEVMQNVDIVSVFQSAMSM